MQHSYLPFFRLLLPLDSARHYILLIVFVELNLLTGVTGGNGKKQQTTTKFHYPVVHPVASFGVWQLGHLPQSSIYINFKSEHLPTPSLLL